MNRASILSASLLLAVTFASPGATGAAEPLDLSYVSSDAVVAIVLRPRETLAAPELEFLPIEVAVAAGKQYFGIDPRDVEIAIGIAGLSGFTDNEPSLGAVLHFAKPYNRAAVLQTVGFGSVEATYNGKTYYRGSTATQPPAFSLYLPDERTIVIGFESQLKRMIEAEKVDTPLTKLLEQADTSKPAVAVLDFASVRPLVMQGLQSLPPLPPAFAPFLKTPELVKWLEISVDIKGQMNVNARVGAESAEAAKQLKDLAEQAKVLARNFINAQVGASLAGGNDPTQVALGQYAQRIVNQFINGIDVRVEDDQLHVALVQGTPAVASTGMMVGLLLPAVQSAREAARRAQSMNNMKMIGLAMHNYLSSKGTFPARSIRDKEGKPLLSWRVAVLPYLEGEAGEALYKQFHLDEPWDSDHNKKLIARMPAAFTNPSMAEPGKTNYLGIAGEGAFFGPFAPRDGLAIRRITDGTSNTIMVVEADPDLAVEWTRPSDLTFDPDKPLAGLGKARPSGFNALMADGSVRFIASTVDPQLFAALVTFAGGERISLP